MQVGYEDGGTVYPVKNVTVIIEDGTTNNFACRNQSDEDNYGLRVYSDNLVFKGESEGTGKLNYSSSNATNHNSYGIACTGSITFEGASVTVDAGAAAVSDDTGQTDVLCSALYAGGDVNFNGGTVELNSGKKNNSSYKDYGVYAPNGSVTIQQSDANIATNVTTLVYKAAAKSGVDPNKIYNAGIYSKGFNGYAGTLNIRCNGANYGASAGIYSVGEVNLGHQVTDDTTEGANITLTSGACSDGLSSALWAVDADINFVAGYLSCKSGSCVYNTASVDQGPVVLCLNSGQINLIENDFNLTNYGYEQAADGYDGIMPSNARRAVEFELKQGLILLDGVANTGTN